MRRQLGVVLAAVAAAAPASIGSASMGKDHIVTLRLRAEGPGDIIGDGLLVYRPGDRDYRSVLRHLHGLKPGQTKPVPPWPDQL